MEHLVINVLIHIHHNFKISFGHITNYQQYTPTIIVQTMYIRIVHIYIDHPCGYINIYQSSFPEVLIL